MPFIIIESIFFSVSSSQNKVADCYTPLSSKLTMTVCFIILSLLQKRDQAGYKAQASAKIYAN